MALSHDCAQVERDNLDLHQALAEALRRIDRLNNEGLSRYPSQDLRAVLDRTSRPVRSQPTLEAWAT